MNKIYLFDTTLRDGMQMEGISLSVEDKLKIAKKLDEFGVDYIECGFPLSNQKDREFFERIKKIKLKRSKVVSFGSTRYKDNKPKNDPGLKALISAGTPAVCIHGKSHRVHVAETLKVSLDENLTMIEDSVAFLKSHKKEVIYDAEHFFDAYKENAAYAIKTLECAAKGGADVLVLCDTNGGTLPFEIQDIFRKVRKRIPAKLGIHSHNDNGCAIANSLIAVSEGAVHVQGTINGYGERCGNADLCGIVPALQLKMGVQALTPSDLKKLTEVSHFVAELANQVPDIHQPYVGQSAFAHKGGTHVHAISKMKDAYEHIDPADVGNITKILVSELSGRSTIELKAKELGMKIDKSSDLASEILKRVENLEAQGYHFEAADASFEVLIRKAAGDYEPFYKLESFRVLIEKQADGKMLSEAVVKIVVNGVRKLQVAEGNGPVNALDKAIRKAIGGVYPIVKNMHLSDYKVRVLNENVGTSAMVRVLIETTDGERSWGTVGVSENIIEASFEALMDSIDHALMRTQKR